MLSQASNSNALAALPFDSGQFFGQVTLPGYEDIMSTMERPKYQNTGSMRQPCSSPLIEERQTVILRTQIRNAISKRESSSRVMDLD